MQYLLTQEEYNALQRDQAVRLTSSRTELQELATQAALHIPVKLDWAPNAQPKPWGCILVPENDPTYCDCCPARIICPSLRKEFSK